MRIWDSDHKMVAFIRGLIILNFPSFLIVLSSRGSLQQLKPRKTKRKNITPTVNKQFDGAFTQAEFLHKRTASPPCQ